MRWLPVLVSALVLVSEPARVRGQVQDPVVDASQPVSGWLVDLPEEARDRGLGDALVDQTLMGLAPLQRVVDNDRAQAELNPGFNRYLSTRVTRTMVKRGQVLAR